MQELILERNLSTSKYIHVHTWCAHENKDSYKVHWGNVGSMKWWNNHWKRREKCPESLSRPRGLRDLCLYRNADKGWDRVLHASRYCKFLHSHKEKVSIQELGASPKGFPNIIKIWVKLKCCFPHDIFTFFLIKIFIGWLKQIC